MIIPTPFYLPPSVFSVAVKAVQEGPLTLAEALKIAEQNAFGVKIADTSVEKARQRAKEAKGSLGPQVSLGATYTRFDKALTSDFNGNTIVTRPIDSKAAQLNFSMPLDIVGVTGKAVKAADLSIRVAEANRDATLNDLHQNVKRAFFSALQANESVKVASEAYDLAKERLENVQKEFNAGERARVDVVRLETALAQADSERIIARNAAEIAKNALNNVLGRPIQTPIELAPQPLWKPTAMTDDDLFNLATENRPDLKALRMQREVLAYVRMSEERGGLPSLNLSAVHSRTFGQGGFGSGASTTSGTVALSVPIWDSGITRARVKQARQDEMAAQVQLDQATLGVSLEVRQAMVNLRNADARVTVAEHQLTLAEENYRLTTIKFTAGEGIPLEVADASNQLTQAKTQLVNARYDYLRAIADLERAVGSDLMPEGTR